MDSVCLLSLVLSLISPNSFNVQQQASSSRNEVDPSYSATVEPGLFYTNALFKGDIGLSLDTPYTGKGVKVGIIDEPINGRDVTKLHDDEAEAHRALSIAQNPYITENDLNHGIHVYDVVSFVAPGADFYSTFSFKSGIEYQRDFLDCAVELVDQFDVDLINHSGGVGEDFDSSSPEGKIIPGVEGKYASMASAGIDRLSAESGVVLFNATGNDDEASFTSSSATGLSTIGVTSSARNAPLGGPGVRKVQTGYGNKILPYFCSAPGNLLYGLPAAWANYIDPPAMKKDRYNPSDYTFYSGTSFSTPLATGIGALILEEFTSLKKNPIALKTVLYCSIYRNLINYQFARMAGQNFVVFDIPADAQNGQQFFSADIRVPKGYVLKAASGVRYDAFNISVGQANTAIDPNSIAYSQLDLKIYGNPTLDTRLVTGLKNANMTSVSFKNASPSDTTYRLTATLSGDKAIGRSEKAAICYYVAPDPTTSVRISDGNFLDAPPSFSYSGPSCGDYIKAVFTDYLGEEVMSVPNLPNGGCLTLTQEQWKTIIDLPNREYYLRFEYKAGDRTLSTQSFAFQEPKEFEKSTLIRPEDFEFPEKYVNEATEESFVFDGIGVSTQRLRCGYIKKMYNNLSPRRSGAGEAYFKLTFDRPLSAVSFGVTIWKNGELMSFREGDSFVLETCANGVWNTNRIDFFAENAELNVMRRNEILRYRVDGPIDAMCFRAKSDPVGSSNGGRVCIGDIVLSEGEEAADYLLGNYEPLVVNETFWDGMPR